MSDELISKKELLQLTKISYGQLYRWKRMNIIPEEWFIKKSASTGQETFFKRDQILERIEIILSMKDDVSLEEIATMFNQKEEEKTIDIGEIEKKCVISQMGIDVFKNIVDNKPILRNKELVILNIIEKYLVNAVITMDELKSLTQIMDEAFEKLYAAEGKLLVYRKLGIALIVGVYSLEEVFIDKQAIKIVEIDLQKEVGEIRRKLMA